MKLLVDVEPKTCSECIFKYISKEKDTWNNRGKLVHRCRLTGELLCHIHEQKSKTCPLMEKVEELKK